MLKTETGEREGGGQREREGEREGFAGQKMPQSCCSNGSRDGGELGTAEREGSSTSCGSRDAG